jgi:hypothetical protein
VVVEALEASGILQGLSDVERFSVDGAAIADFGIMSSFK